MPNKSCIYGIICRIFYCVKKVRLIFYPTNDYNDLDKVKREKKVNESEIKERKHSKKDIRLETIEDIEDIKDIKDIKDIEDTKYRSSEYDENKFIDDFISDVITSSIKLVEKDEEYEKEFANKFVNNIIETSIENSEIAQKEFVNKFIRDIMQKVIKDIEFSEGKEPLSEEDWSENSSDGEWRDAEEWRSPDKAIGKSENSDVGYWVDKDDTVNIELGFIEQYDVAKIARKNIEKCDANNVNNDQKVNFDNMYRGEDGIRNGDSEDTLSAYSSHESMDNICIEQEYSKMSDERKKFIRKDLKTTRLAWAQLIKRRREKDIDDSSIMHSQI